MIYCKWIVFRRFSASFFKKPQERPFVFNDVASFVFFGISGHDDDKMPLHDLDVLSYSRGLAHGACLRPAASASNRTGLQADVILA